jgi:hypothetical protein
MASIGASGISKAWRTKSLCFNGISMLTPACWPFSSHR